MKECVHCDIIGQEWDGVWKIKISKKWRGTYGKRDGPICHNCLSEALTGYRSGGGLIGNVIKKIKRVRKG